MKMRSEDLEDLVLVNAEGQYSLWPDASKIPVGWAVIFQSGERRKCLEWIGKNWTDMRPKSVRS